MKKQTLIRNVPLTLVCGLILSASVFAQVRTWGRNSNVQIGDGTTIDRSSPTLTAPALVDIINIHGGEAHTLAVRANGTVLSWGYNFHGELGNGTTNTTGCYCNPTPGVVPSLTNVVAVSGGLNHSLALKSDGTVWAWGSNANGSLGDGTTTPRLTPVQVGVRVLDFNNIIAIDAGTFHNIALKSDGTVWVWGDNIFGQIGDGTSGVGDNRKSPVQVTALSNSILAVSAGRHHSMALTKTGGRIYAWGGNDRGQIGNGASDGFLSSPLLVPNIREVAQIQAGYQHSVALRTNGTVSVWGRNDYGQIGNGAVTSLGCMCIPTPRQNSTLNGITAIRAENSDHTLARKKNGSIWAWGLNFNGQIGNGTTNTAPPYAVLTPVQSSVGTGSVTFGTGGHHSLLSVPRIFTSVGTNIISRLDNGYVRFNNVTRAGDTTIAAIDPAIVGLPVPAGLTIAENEQAYNISTTATTAGSDILVCLNVSTEYDQSEFSKFRLLHGEGNALVDRTQSKNYQTREICAQVTSLSPFVFAKSLVSTAAQVSVSGRVLTERGTGLRNARVNLTDSAGNTRTTTTSAAGIYHFEEVGVGGTFTLQVTSKRYLFYPQVVNVTEEISGLDFRAQY